KELDVADQFDTTRDRGLDRGQSLGNARTYHHQIGTGKGVVGEWSLEDRHPGELGGERSRARRIRARVGDRDMRATTRGPARRRQTREPKAENDHVPVAQARRHLSFKVVSPNNTRSMVTIQNLTTT